MGLGLMLGQEGPAKADVVDCFWSESAAKTSQLSPAPSSSRPRSGDPGHEDRDFDLATSDQHSELILNRGMSAHHCGV